MVGHEQLGRPGARSREPAIPTPRRVWVWPGRGGGSGGGGGDDGDGDGGGGTMVVVTVGAAQAVAAAKVIEMSESEPAGSRASERASARPPGLASHPRFAISTPPLPPSVHAAPYPASSPRSPPPPSPPLPSPPSSTSTIAAAAAAASDSYIPSLTPSLMRFGRPVRSATTAFVRSFVRSCIPGRESSCRVLANVCETRVAHDSHIRRIYGSRPHRSRASPFPRKSRP